MQSDENTKKTPVAFGAADVAVIIITFNEAANISQAVASCAGWAREIFVLDSFSVDRTSEIACALGAHVAQNKFENFGKQRNHALDHLPIESEWVLFLDADEWLPPALKEEISRVLAATPVQNGFYLNRRLIWMGRWIRRGYYPSWILRLFRRTKGRCEDRAVNEHLIVEGKCGRLRNDFMHEDRKGVGDWISKHNGYASREALEIFAKEASPEYREIEASLFGEQAERRRWLRIRVWNRLPPLLRPFLYFAYRYVLRGGFLDGRAGFVFHFLHALWYPMLIDVKYLEEKMRRRCAE